ncbi:MAG: prefoldin subunit alpha [Candidatus Bathyarchaeota archaeon]|nr:prefoldin subunit alpha [Candidatus Termiticorpusculum sp.]MCL2868743.1 prefoldin subunit alpha [Candidatus Termiticorpusculum sp.]
MAANSKNNQEELQKLSVEMRYLEQTAEALQQRINMLNAALADLTYANTTLDGLQQEKENAEMLVPIGGSSYVQVKLTNPDKIIVGLGAGVSVEKSLTDAKTTLKERLDELTKALQAAQTQFNQIAERLNSGQRRIESLLTNAKQRNA